MKTLSFLLMFFFVLSCSDNKVKYETLSFEVRLAYSEPGSGLTEMTMQKSDLKFYVQDSVFLNNQDISSTDVIDWETHPKVMVRLNDLGREKFKAFTEQNIGKNAAILVGRKLVSAPRINAKIEEGKLIIVGHFTPEEAKKISMAITTIK
jgi:preprotein translocase subunit SecD